MNAEELKYYKALQPKFREILGWWIEGDAVTNNAHGIGFVVAVTDERLGVFFPSGLSDDLNGVRWFPVDTHLYRLPLPIDPVNQERGLLGMFLPNTLIFLKPVFRMYFSQVGGNLKEVDVDNDNTHTASFHSGDWGCKISDVAEPFIGSTPALALLKALAHQWGIEVPA